MKHIPILDWSCYNKNVIAIDWNKNLLLITESPDQSYFWQAQIVNQTSKYF